ncbi:MAG: hypothetical protein K0V04_17710 [Deltaproteobacteria bacterium]|nr:hypothetical protein [Deltaproteobacteria bacterium]
MALVPSLVQFRAHSLAPRHEALVGANDALTECGVLLEDMQEFSNRMITYRFEIARDQLSRLRERLVALGFTIEGPPPNDAELTTDADDFVRGTLQLTLPNEDGDRRNPNPDLG